MSDTDPNSGAGFWRRKMLELKPDAPPGALNSEEMYAPANKWLADELRKLADHIEADKGWPKVYSCAVPDTGPEGAGALMLRYEVVLSHPWPG